MENYVHKVQYYETDRMGITHHSNYIRWMEEARVDYLDQIGFGYDRLEELGVMSPVIGINAEYKESTRFNDEVFAHFFRTLLGTSNFMFCRLRIISATKYAPQPQRHSSKTASKTLTIARAATSRFLRRLPLLRRLIVS